MNNILYEISKIRGGKEIFPDRSNRNRYRIVSLERDGSRSAYYFGVPIYNDTSKKLLTLSFQEDAEGYHLDGSNSDITVKDGSILLQNKYGSCSISMPCAPTSKGEKAISYEGAQVYPTTNGIAIKADLNTNGEFRFRLKCNYASYQLRNNNKYFALMRDTFKPFFAISCIGALRQNGTLFAPASIKSQKISDTEFELCVLCAREGARQVLFEVNLHDQKFIQDTTVESKNPNQNNAFGGTAFIGNSDEFGEQWLYSRPDVSILNDIFESYIEKAVLYIPLLNENGMKLSAVGLSNRFCSFGSNWNNKIPFDKRTSISDVITGYQKIDISNMITNNHKLLTSSEGWLIKSAVKGSGFSALSTADSFYAPQILEVAFK